MSPIFFTLLCLGIGLFSGFLGGLLGIGGGIVIVPALVILFDWTGILPLAHSTPAAVATSLACIVFTSLSAAYAQVRAGRVEWLIVRRWAVPVTIGAAAAGYLAPLLPVPVFRGFIGLFLGLVSVVMLTRWTPHPHRSFPAPTTAGGIGFGAGLVSGIAGIGGGNVMVPTMIYFNTAVHRATATSSSLGVPLATAGALGYILFAPSIPAAPEYMLGYVHLSKLRRHCRRRGRRRPPRRLDRQPNQCASPAPPVRHPAHHGRAAHDAVRLGGGLIGKDGQSIWRI